MGRIFSASLATRYVTNNEVQLRRQFLCLLNFIRVIQAEVSKEKNSDSALYKNAMGFRRD
jgi:hypothetical protein